MKRTEQGIESERLSKAARQRAYARLANLHPEQFKVLHMEERIKDGWVPTRYETGEPDGDRGDIWHTFTYTQTFLEEGFGAACDCGWEHPIEFGSIEEAQEAWENHCDAVFMEATTAHVHSRTMCAADVEGPTVIWLCGK